MPSKLEQVMLVLVATLSIGWHLASLQSAWETSGKGAAPRDFASYYYADAALDAGKDPYVTRHLRAEARKDAVFRGIHPFFYPPPFALFIDGLSALDVRTAYQWWFWMDALATLAVALALGWWWRRLGLRVSVLVALSLAALSAIPNNHVMGQANMSVLLLVLLGLWSDSVGRSPLAGILVGTACMLKMSPALFVAWWLLRGRLTSASWAVGTAVGLTLASLWSVPAEIQWRFYTEVLPTFGTGAYNGLTVGIDLFGNHSIPDLYNAIWPAQSNRVLSPMARVLSSGTALVLCLGTLTLLRRAPVDAWAAAGQVGALFACMLLVPVYTYEHHLVFAIPSAVVAGGAALHGRLSARWLLPVALAWCAWCVPLPWLRASAAELSLPMSLLVEECKWAALVLFYVSCISLGASPPRRKR